MAKSNKSFWMSDEDQKGDFSNDKRDTFEPEKGYVGIRLQQGVPLLDRDWNEMEDIRRYQEVSLRKNYIGNGTPDDGFRIQPSDIENDFLITRGRYLIEGLEADSTNIRVNDKDPDDLKKEIPFKKLYPDITLSAPAAGTSRIDAVYLEVTISEIGHNDDQDLKNDGDVNMATCLRHKLKWAVKVAEGAEMPPSEQFIHRSLLATITRKGSVIMVEEITDKRSKLKTLHQGNEGHLRVNGPLDVTGGLLVEDGNVGIGTTDPKAKLHVVGDLKADGTVNIGGTTNELIYLQDPDGKTKWHINLKGDPKDPSKPNGFNLAETHIADGRLFIKYGGNVGIGTMTPEARLHVEGGEIHIGGHNAGFSFANRDDPFVPEGNGKRWVWYAQGKKACLWSGGIEPKLVIDASGNVGIGTISPEAKLHLIGIPSNANGSHLVIGPKNASNLRLGHDNTYSWIQSHGQTHLAINPEGNNVGIGTTTPAAKLDVAGDLNVKGKLWLNRNYSLGHESVESLNAVVLRYFEDKTNSNYLYYINGRTNWAQPSSQKLKTNIAAITDVIQKLDQIHGVYFNWKEENISALPGAQKQRHIGMIAEEVQAVFPELVSRAPDEDREILGLDYSSFTAVLVQAVKELKALNQSLSERVKALEVSAAH